MISRGASFLRTREGRRFGSVRKVDRREIALHRANRTLARPTGIEPVFPP